MKSMFVIEGSRFFGTLGCVQPNGLKKKGLRRGRRGLEAWFCIWQGSGCAKMQQRCRVKDTTPAEPLSEPPAT